MDITKILAHLRAERDSIERAIAAIEALATDSTKFAATRQSAPPARRKRRHISAAGRKRLSEMMKRRWAARKKAGKSRLG